MGHEDVVKGAVERVRGVVERWKKWEKERSFLPATPTMFAEDYVRKEMGEAFQRPWATEERSVAGKALDEHDRLLLEGWSRWLTTEGVRFSQVGVLPGTTYLLDMTEVGILGERFIKALNGEEG